MLLQFMVTVFGQQLLTAIPLNGNFSHLNNTIDVAHALLCPPFYLNSFNHYSYPQGPYS